MLRLQVLKRLGDVIHTSMNTFTMESFTINFSRESGITSCMIVGSDNMDQGIVKQDINKKNPSDVSLISLQFSEISVTIKRHFGEELDKQLNQVIAEFADVKEEPQGLTVRRGHLDHKVKLTG